MACLACAMVRSRREHGVRPVRRCVHDACMAWRAHRNPSLEQQGERWSTSTEKELWQFQVHAELVTDFSTAGVTKHGPS